MPLPLRLLLGLLLSMPAFADEDADRRTIADIVQSTIERDQPQPATGVAVAVLRGGKLFWMAGFGERDRERHLPVTVDTLFPVASTTKAFAATLLAQQAHDGLIELDQPIKGQLSGYDLRLDQAEVAEKITISDMLSHQTGWPRHDLLWIKAPYDAAALLPRLQYVGMNEESGQGYRETFQYTNVMYMAAGQASAALAGKNWDVVASEKLLAPLGMTRSSFDLATVFASEDFALGYTGAQLQPTVDFAPVGAAGGLNSSARDMARWVELHLQRGLGPDGTRVISEAALEATYRSRINAGDGWGYGLGWFVGEIGGDRIIHHSGNSTASTAVVMFMPERGLGVVVLTNQAWSGLPSTIGSAVLNYLHATDDDTESLPRDYSAYLAIPMTIERGVLPRQAPMEREAEDDAPLRRCVGRFTDPAYGEISLTRAERPGQSEQLMLRHHAGDFILKSDSVDNSARTKFQVPWSWGGMSMALPGRFIFDGSGACVAVELKMEYGARASRFVLVP